MEPSLRQSAGVIIDGELRSVYGIPHDPQVTPFAC